MRQGATPPRSSDGNGASEGRAPAAEEKEQKQTEALAPEAGRVEQMYGADPEPSSLKLPRAPRASACQPFVRKQIAQALPELCRAFLDKAKQGDLPTMKLLWQMAELDKQTAPPGEQDRDRKFVRQALAKFHRR